MYNNFLFGQIIDNAMTGFILVDSQGKIQEVNPELEKMLGYEDEGNSPKGNVFEYVHEDDKSRLRDQLDKRKKKKSAKYNLRLKRYKQDKPLHCEFHAFPLTDEAGDYLGSFAWVQDVSEKVELEDSIRKQKDTVASLEERKKGLEQQIERLETQAQTDRRFLEQVLECLPDAVLVIDRKGRATHWNHAAEDLTKIKAESIIGKGNEVYSKAFYGKSKPILVDYTLEHATDGKLDMKKLCDYHEIKVDETTGIANAVANINEKNLWLSGRAAPIYAGPGRKKVIGAIEVVRNITEEKAREESDIRERNLRRSLNTWRNVTHEISTRARNIITMSSGNINEKEIAKCIRDLERSLGNSESGVNLEGIVKEYVVGLFEQLGRVLDSIQEDVGKKILKLKEINVRKFLQDEVSIFVALSEQKGLKFETDFSGIAATMVRSDDIVLSTILCNLLDNALKFTLKGEIHLSVAISSSGKPEEEGLIFSIKVRDTGPGIKKEEQGKVFEKHRSVRMDENIPGSGLGLYYTKGLAQMLGGDITFDSEPGKGSCFNAHVIVELSPNSSRSTQKLMAIRTLEKPEEHMVKVEMTKEVLSDRKDKDQKETWFEVLRSKLETLSWDDMKSVVENSQIKQENLREALLCSIDEMMEEVLKEYLSLGREKLSGGNKS